MKKLIYTAGSISLLFFAQASVACDYPRRIVIPDGATASTEEMIAGVKKVEQYKLDMAVYLECITEDEKAALAAVDDLQPEVEQQREEMLNKKYNAAVEDEETLVAKFNVEIRAYKAREE